MLISDFADYQWSRVKPLANTPTFVYNRKVNQGKERSNLPDCLYIDFVIFMTTVEKDTQFAARIARAALDYGVCLNANKLKFQAMDEISWDLLKAIQDNWNEIEGMIVDGSQYEN